MKIHFTLILALTLSSILFGQRITYTHLNLTSENLKEILLNSGEYFTGENTELPYFQGKQDSKYIKFYKSTGDIVTIDFKTDSEYLSIIYDIQNNAVFRFKFCTDYEENIVYNYQTSSGNKIRFDYGKMRISVEYNSELNSFLDSNSDFGSTFICESDNSYAYHTNIKCSGLGNCEANVSKTNIRSAKKSGYKICKICTDDSYSRGRISEIYKSLNQENDIIKHSKSEPIFEEKEKINYYDLLGYSRVSFNKNVIAYTVIIKNKKNGIEGKEKMKNPNINNPHYISIRSNKQNGGTLTIKNKDYKDIIINFTKVYQSDYKDGNTAYYFITENPNYSMFYVDVNGSNDFLFIQLNQDSENGISIDYTISEI
jgi:hypothetical protein